MGVKLNLGALNIKLTLDDENFRSSMARARKRLNSLGKGFAMSAGAGGAVLGAGIAYAVQQYSDLEHAVQKAAAVTKEGAENFGLFQQEAFKASAGTQFSAKQAADALGFLSMAGFEAGQSVAALPGVLDLATAANIDLARAADITSNILTAAKLPISDLSRVNDVLVATITSSNTNMEMLAETMKYVMPVAAAFDQSLESTAAIAGLMANGGIQASQAGTTMRAMFTRLIKPMRTNEKAMKSLNISIRDGKGGFVDMIDVIGQLEEAQSKLAKDDFEEMVARAFGPEALSGVLAVLAEGSEKLREFKDMLDASGGTAERVATLMRETLSSQLQILRGNVENLAAQFGQMLAPAVKRVTKLLTEQVVALQTDKEAYRKVRDAVAGGIKTFADFVEVMGHVAAAGVLVGGVLAEVVNGLAMLKRGVEAIAVVAAGVFVSLTEDPMNVRAALDKVNEELLQQELHLEKLAKASGTYIKGAAEMAGKLVDGSSEAADAFRAGATELEGMTQKTFNATVGAEKLKKQLNGNKQALDDMKDSADAAYKSLKRLTDTAVRELNREMDTLLRSTQRDLAAQVKKRKKEREVKEKSKLKEAQKRFKKEQEDLKKTKELLAQLRQNAYAKWEQSLLDEAEFRKSVLSGLAGVFSGVASDISGEGSLLGPAVATASDMIATMVAGTVDLTSAIATFSSAALSAALETEAGQDALRVARYSFKRIVGEQGTVLNRLVDSFDSVLGLIDTIQPLGGLLDSLGSVFDVVGRVAFVVIKSVVLRVEAVVIALQAFKVGLLYLMKGLNIAIRAVLNAVNKILPERLEINTSRFDNNISELNDKIADAKDAVGDTASAIKDIATLSYDEAKAKAQAAQETARMAEEMKDLNNELRNAPSGFKRLLERSRFNADAGGPGQTPMSMRTSMLRPAPTSSTTHVHIYGVTKAEEVVEVLERKNFLTTGSMTAYQAARFNGSMRSKLTG